MLTYRMTAVGRSRESNHADVEKEKGIRGGGRKARKFGGGYGRRKRGSNTRDGQGGGKKRKSAMRLNRESLEEREDK